MSSAAPGLTWKRLSRRFRTPLHTATGLHETRDSLVLRWRDVSGRSGYGEVAPWPGFPTESLAEAEALLNETARRDGGYESPACALNALSPLSPHAFAVPYSGPCLAAALSHASAWLGGDWGRAGHALDCAALCPDRDLAAAVAKRDAGFDTLKFKIGVGALRDEQRGIAALVRELGPGVMLRLDANGALDAGKCAAWCDFLSEYPEVEWLEQPMAPGCEDAMAGIAARSGVAERLALDESVSGEATFDTAFPGVFVVKPALAGDPERLRAAREAAGFPRVAYSSVFESPFGRQAALCIAGASPGERVAGFGTLGVFDDDLDVHEPGPVAKTVVRDEAFWEALWNRL